MTLDRARQQIADQVAFGSGYNRNATRLILAEVEREHGGEFVDKFILEFDLETVFALKSGTRFNS